METLKSKISRKRDELNQWSWTISTMWMLMQLVPLIKQF